jgi:GNAT superfamily N-acetyltransferase
LVVLSLSEFILTEVRDQSVLQEIFALRIIAWREQATIPACVNTWTDATDQIAYHWAVFQRGKLAAAACLSIHVNTRDLPDAEIYRGVPLDAPPPIGSMNRCVVHPDFRRRGLATVLDKTRIEKARSLRCQTIVVAADNEHRLRQIQSYGFRKIATGEPYRDGPSPRARGTICIMHI